MGVAVMTRTLVPPSRPLDCRARRWWTPKRCCSSMMATARSLKTTSGWNRAWVPIRMSIRPACKFCEDGVAGLAFFAPRQHRDVQAGGLGERFDGLDVLAGEHFSRCHDCCLRADFVGDRAGQQGDDRLA